MRMESVESARPEITVLIPVLNEEGSLPTLYQRLTETLGALGRSYEILFIDDGSRDATPRLMREFAAVDPRVRIVELSRNFGQHAAIFAGFEEARGDILVTLDADLQNPPEEIPVLIAKIDEGFDVVGGWRENRQDPFFRRFASPEIDEFAGLAAVMQRRRGERVFEQGAAGTAWYIVVRGAVEIANAHDGRRRQVGILGPGRLCGLLALIEERPHSMSAVAREDATLMEFDRRAFERLYCGADRLSSRFQEAVNQELLTALARTNNHLARLISQARIRDARTRADVEALQQALGTQDCRLA